MSGVENSERIKKIFNRNHNSEMRENNGYETRCQGNLRDSWFSILIKIILHSEKIITSFSSKIE